MRGSGASMPVPARTNGILRKLHMKSGNGNMPYWNWCGANPCLHAYVVAAGFFEDKG